MPRIEVFAAVAFAIALAYLWMRWDKCRELRKKVEHSPAGTAGGRKDQ